MFTVKIWIYTAEWEQGGAEEIIIQSERSLKGAKSKATRWINRNYFECDILNTKKGFETRKRADWTLTLRNPFKYGEI